MKTGRIVPVGVVLGLVLAFLSAGQQSAEQLYKSGLYEEEVSGDLQKAIGIYQELLKRFPDNREIAAKAQLHIGLCYEKQGFRQAQEAFQRVVDDYPEQREEVGLAKERLARLAQAQVEEKDKPGFRKIRIPANPGNGVLSPDGKLLAFTSQGSVWLVPVHGRVQPDLAGEPVRLTDPMGATNIGNIMAWSGDGQWIAFNATEGQKIVVYAVSAAGGKPKRIPADPFRTAGDARNFRVSLSADGRTLVFCSADTASSDKERRASEPVMSRLYSIPVDGGEAKRLTDERATEPAYSPDGKRIAFIRPSYAENGILKKKDLWVVNSDGSGSTQVADFPGNARGPVWSPDGKMIAFHIEHGSNSSFSHEIWIVPAPTDRRPSGSPTKIRLPFESYSIIAGWTTDLKMGILMASPRHQAVYTVPASGGEAAQISPETASRFTGNEDFEGYPCHPRWSPDGKTVYFRWGKGHIVAVPSQGGNLITVHSSKETKVIEALPGGGNNVSPDGKKIVFSAYQEGVRPLSVGIWTVPAEGGEPGQITKSPAQDAYPWVQDRYPCWSPDGKRIAFIRSSRRSKDETVANICLVSADGGEVRQLTTDADKVNFASIAWSPGGDQIAYFSLDKTINVRPLQGGEPRAVVNVDSVHGHCELCWSPDGKELAYTSKGRIMVMPLAGGGPREIKTGILNEEVQNFHISWSPDGKKFVFTAGFGGDEELWLMENFLPGDKKK